MAAKVRVHPTPEPQETPAVKPPADTFTFMTPAGVAFVVGRPQGVQKLRLRAVLTTEQMTDPELREIAKALLSVRTIDGAPVTLRSPEHFEITLSRFADDATVDAFMSEWQKFTNPEVYDAVAKALQDGLSKGLSGDKLTEHVQATLADLAAQQVSDVQNL
jgi:hypothetical protein